MHKVEKNVFILGNPRSGTTLLRIILNNHQNIIAPPECGFAHWWLEKYINWSWEQSKSNLSAFLKDLANSKKIETWHLDFNKLKELIIQNEPNTYGDLVNLVYLSYANEFEKIKVVVDKNNYYLNHLEDLNRIWPNSIYLHLIRDGRDVASSYLKIKEIDDKFKYKPKLTDNISAIAKEWVCNNDKIESLGLKFPNRYFRLRYEDLILNTAEVLQNLCDFLNLEFDPEALKYYENKDFNKIEPEETIQWKQKTREKPDSGNIGKFRDEMTPENIKAFMEIGATTLQKYDYH